MRTKILLGTILSAALALGYMVILAPAPAEANGPKNLKVMPGNTSMDEVRSAMKGMSRALGVKCEHCHDMDDMAKDTPKKRSARGMMRMTNVINRRHLKGSSAKVTCMTCHRGEKTPSK